MNKKLQTGLIIGIIFLNVNTFSQTTAKTYLDVVLNIVSTNIDYGKSNSALTDYKNQVLGVQAGASFQAGITRQFSLVTELYFIMKGGTLKTNNPLTTYKTTLRLYA